MVEYVYSRLEDFVNVPTERLCKSIMLEGGTAKANFENYKLMRKRHTSKKDSRVLLYNILKDLDSSIKWVSKACGLEYKEQNIDRKNESIEGYIRKISLRFTKLMKLGSVLESEYEKKKNDKEFDNLVRHSAVYIYAVNKRCIF